MINETLQFIKKTILSIKLARHNALFLVEDLKSFKKAVVLARAFEVTSPLSPQKRAAKFLSMENSPFLNALADEINVRKDIAATRLPAKAITPYPLRGDVLFKTAIDKKERDLYLPILNEIIKTDYPESKSQYNHFLRRLDILSDMRFYASELELLNEDTFELERNCLFEIDWIRTSKSKLYLSFDENCRFTSRLDVQAQESLAHLFAFLLFEKKRFISCWNGVSLDSQGNVNFLDFDFLNPADESLLEFARQYAQNSEKNHPQPATLEEYKMQRALELLELYCPDIRVFRLWEAYRGSQQELNIYEEENSHRLLEQLQTHGVLFKSASEPQFASPEDLAYLLDKSRHQNSYSAKSNFLYWGPLLAIGSVWIYYF